MERYVAGDGEILGAYPDLFSNYWEYTYNMNEYPDVALRIEGQFPHARYFSFSLYDDETGSAIGGINDHEIIPDEGSENPSLARRKKTTVSPSMSYRPPWMRHR